MNAISVPTWQAGFLALLPAVTTHAKIKFRKLPADQREESVAEAIAAACVNYQLAAVQGKLDAVHASTLGDFAIRHVRTGRHVGGRQNAAKDPLSPTCQRRHGVTVVSCHAQPSNAGRSEGWKQVAIESRKAKVPDLAAFRIDFAAWLRSFTRRDRKIIAAFIRGDRTCEVAQQFAVTEGRISQLRRRFEHDWAVFQQHAA